MLARDCPEGEGGVSESQLLRFRPPERHELCEWPGRRSANVRGDGQKLHRRPGLGASWHLMAKPVGAADKVNAALVHGNIAFLPGEICRA